MAGYKVTTRAVKLGAYDTGLKGEQKEERGAKELKVYQVKTGCIWVKRGGKRNTFKMSGP